MNPSTLYRFLIVAVFLGFTHSASGATISWAALAASATVECPGGLCLITSEEAAEGGINMASATTLVDNAQGEAFAQAALTGSAFTPTLGVRADTRGIADTLALASASGLQAYTNTGTDTTTITLALTLTTGMVSGAGADASSILFPLDATNVVYSLLDVYRTDALEFIGDDINTLTLISEPAEVSAPILYKTVDQENLSTSIEITDVAPGESFLIWAGLFAKAQGVDGFADASSTLTMELFEGLNPQDLSPIDLSQFSVASQNVGVVPLPAGVWLFLTGIGLIAGLSRRRKSQTAS